MTRGRFDDIMRAAGKAISRIGKDQAPGQAATTSLLLTFDQAELDALDQWIASRPDPKPSRLNAAKALIGEGLRLRR